MTINDIDTIRKLANATEPDWVAETNDKGHAWINLPAYPHAWGMHGFVDEAKFAAAARTLVPALCDEIEQLRAEVKKLGMYRTRYFEVQDLLDDVLGPNEEDGTGEGIVQEVALVAEQRDTAREQLSAHEDDIQTIRLVSQPEQVPGVSR